LPFQAGIPRCLRNRGNALEKIARERLESSVHPGGLLSQAAERLGRCSGYIVLPATAAVVVGCGLRVYAFIVVRFIGPKSPDQFFVR